MLHAMFQGHKTSGSGEDFERFSHIWVKRPSWSCDLDHLFPRRLHTKFGFDLQSGFSLLATDRSKAVVLV